MSKRLPDDIVAEQVERMYVARRGFPLLLGAVALPAGYAYVHAGDGVTSAWAVAAVGTMALRIVGGQAYARLGSRSQPPRTQTLWQVAYLAASLSAVLSLAGLTVSALWADHMLLFAWTLATLVGGAYGAVSWVCHRPWIGIPQTTVPLVVVAAALAAHGETIYWLMAGSLVIAAISLVEHVLRQHGTALALIENRRKIEGQAVTDVLTGLWNRRHFDEALRAITSSPGVSGTLLLVDLDRFKPVNDTHGHDVGDAVLQEAAVRIASACGPEAFVARIGGDEFAVLTLAPPDQADLVADRIADVVAVPITVEGATFRIGASVGAAPVRTGDDPRTVVREADRRMYARKAGRLAAA